MSKFDYDYSRSMEAEDPPFYALIMCAMRRADSNNLERLKEAFPMIWEELQARYHAPGGMLPGELAGSKVGGGLPFLIEPDNG